MPEKVEDQKKGYVFQAIMIALTFFVFVASCDPSEYTAMGWLILFVVVTIFVGGFAYSVRKAMQFRQKETNEKINGPSPFFSLLTN